MAKIMTWRVWLALIVLVMAVIAIKPTFNTEGIVIKSLSADSMAAQQGVASGQLLLAINGQEIKTLQDVTTQLALLEAKQQKVTVATENGTYTYNITGSIGFKTDTNLTVLETEQISPITEGDIILSINSEQVKNSTELQTTLNKILPKQRITIDTNKGKFVYLDTTGPKITAAKKEPTNLKKGLDLEGGTRVLLKPVSDNGTVSDSEISDIISILNNRLNVYGLSDLKIRPSKDWQGNKYILIEIAGITKEEVMDLIGNQGKFEAKIGNEVVFSGGKKDIPFVCRNDGSCSGIRSCTASADGQQYCRFEFSIHLSPEAAEKHAEVTGKLEVITSDDGKEILSEKLDFYLDGKKVDSLQIGADLKGQKATAISISGPGLGATRQSAVEEATANMNKLQTVLITGSLPMKLEVQRLDSISPALGKQFITSSILIGILAIAAVALVLIIRYRSLKLALPLVATSVSEVIMILGFAGLTGWNLDMAGIAGIIAAVGTGVDAQIIILDEMLRKESATEMTNWKQKVKNAFFVIFASYATLVASMLPLWNAGAGMLRGFALTTIVGITMAVLITRPAYADIVKALYENKQ